MNSYELVPINDYTNTNIFINKYENAKIHLNIHSEYYIFAIRFLILSMCFVINMYINDIPHQSELFYFGFECCDNIYAKCKYEQVSGVIIDSEIIHMVDNQFDDTFLLIDTINYGINNTCNRNIEYTSYWPCRLQAGRSA